MQPPRPELLGSHFKGKKLFGDALNPLLIESKNKKKVLPAREKDKAPHQGSKQAFCPFRSFRQFSASSSGSSQSRAFKPSWQACKPNRMPSSLLHPLHLPTLRDPNPNDYQPFPLQNTGGWLGLFAEAWQSTTTDQWVLCPGVSVTSKGQALRTDVLSQQDICWTEWKLNPWYFPRSGRGLGT